MSQRVKIFTIFYESFMSFVKDNVIDFLKFNNQ